LLSFQILIVLVVAIVIARISVGKLKPNIRRGRLLLALGGIYFFVMLLRLVFGLTIFSSVPWFAKPIPAFFHLVLASIVLLIGHGGYKRGNGVRQQ
jgi:hypothetical protein